jgi:hypothetical protein
MHSQDIYVDGELYTVHTNGDFSGNVKINFNATINERKLEMPFVTHQGGTDNKPFWTVELPFDLLAELVGRWVQGNAIDQLEDQTGIEVLMTRR